MFRSTHTGDLVVGQPIRLGLGHEPLHTQNVQVPLVGILPQGTDLKTRRRALVGDTSDGEEAFTLALGELLGDDIHLGLDDIVVGEAPGVVVVVCAMVEGSGEVEERQEGEDHGHDVLGLAEAGHGE